MKKVQLVILFFIPQRATIKTLKSNSTIKPNLSSYLLDVKNLLFFASGKIHFIFIYFQ